MKPPIKKAVILTGHFAFQKRRASMLWLSDELQANGWHVTLITVGYSWVSWLRRDRRFESLDGPPKRGTRIISETLTTIFQYAPIHPFSLRYQWVDTLVRPLHKMFAAYWRPHLRMPLKDADLVIIESGPPIMLTSHVVRCATKAALVYRVSDDVALLGQPAFLCEAELKYAPMFDRISMASPYLARKFSNYPSVAINPNGIPTSLYKDGFPDPFGTDRAKFEAVCAGTTQFDMQAILSIARLRPKWRLHIFGRLRNLPPNDAPSNIIFHGEQSFPKTSAFIKYADIGLAPYLDFPGVEYQTLQSNRILQYRFFGLPIIGPARLCDPVIPSIYGYGGVSDDSLEICLRNAESHVRKEPEPLPDWHDLYCGIVSTERRQQSNLQPPVSSERRDNTTIIC